MSGDMTYDITDGYPRDVKEGDPMTTPCRFKTNEPFSYPHCCTHSTPIIRRYGANDICDIGLAALRLQLDESVKDGLVLALKLDDQARVIEELIALLQEAQAQWGEDYLWKKWGMSEELTRLKALSPTPTEPKEG